MSVPTVDPADGADAGADLRAARRARVLDAMAAAGLDVLVLGRRDSVAYATGARALWTAGTRPFGAACVVVAATGSTHLLSTWDTGVPPEIPFDHLYGVTWNPATMGAALAATPGFVDARRIGVDALSPGFARAVARLAPGAEVVPADDALRAVRAVKLPAEIERIRAAVAVAHAGVDAALDALAGGASDPAALGAAWRAVGELGVTVPTSEPVVRSGPAVGDGPRLVRVDLGFLVDGYEGGLGRTVPLEPGDERAPALLGRAADAHQQLVAACTAGASGASLAAAAGAAGTSSWSVRGTGMGAEPPVISDRLGHDAVLVEGEVLSVGVAVAGAARRDVVVVRGGGPESLTSASGQH